MDEKEKDKYIEEVNDLYFKIDEILEEFDKLVEKAFYEFKSKTRAIARKVQEKITEYQNSVGLNW
jgi:ElaB/YqjD/DUF883 family membrane-anchored ribosome-binding protein